MSDEALGDLGMTPHSAIDAPLGDLRPVMHSQSHLPSQGCCEDKMEEEREMLHATFGPCWGEKAGNK